MKKYFKIPLFFILHTCCTFFASAQTDQEKLQDVVFSAFYAKDKTDEGAIYFERIAHGLKNPEDILSIQKDKYFTGTHYFFKGSKMDAKLGDISMASDGKVLVMVAEDERTIIIDSAGTGSDNGPAKGMEQLAGFLDSLDSDYRFEYTGQKKFSNKTVDVYTSKPVVSSYDVYAKDSLTNFSRTKQADLTNYSPDDTPREVIYYLDKETKQLALMAEKYAAGYDVYWVKEIKEIAPGFSFKLKLPAKELKQFNGYKVIDNRYSQNY